MQEKARKELPDIIINDKSNYYYTLGKVGMEGIEIPISFDSRRNAPKNNLKGVFDIYVNLIDKKSKGIHMSRLYLLLIDFFDKNKFDFNNLESLHKELCGSQAFHSDKSYLNIGFDYSCKRKSLLSGHEAYRYYPVKVFSSYKTKSTKKKLKLELEISILYSSTCPCSASLSQKSIKDDFIKKLIKNKRLNEKNLIEWLDNKESLSATPHAQRSLAKVRFCLKNNEVSPTLLFDLINDLEKVIKTPVQTAVKREDEQYFAKLNAENLMFCEDSCRIIKDYFLKNKNLFEKYKIKIIHYESLHAHNAVAFDSNY